MFTALAGKGSRAQRTRNNGGHDEIATERNSSIHSNPAMRRLRHITQTRVL